MVKILYDFLFTHSPLPEELNEPDKLEALIALLDKLVITTHHKHKILLLEAGEVPEKVYFIESGVMRAFTYESKGNKERTVALWLGNSMVTDVTGFTHRIKTDWFIEAMADTVLTSITYDQLKNIFDTFPGSSAFLNCLIENDIKKRNGRLSDQKLKAWDHLEKIRQTHPKLELLVPKEIIASFLNISPQHLSKIIRENR